MVGHNVGKYRCAAEGIVSCMTCDELVAASVRAAAHSTLMSRMARRCDMMMAAEGTARPVPCCELLYGREYYSSGHMRILEVHSINAEAPCGYAMACHSILFDGLSDVCIIKIGSELGMSVHVARNAPSLAIVQRDGELVGVVRPDPPPHPPTSHSVFTRIWTEMRNYRMWRKSSRWGIWLRDSHMGTVEFPWVIGHDSLRIARPGKCNVPIELGCGYGLGERVLTGGDPEWIVARSAPELAPDEEVMLLAVTLFYRMVIRCKTVFS